MATDRDNRVFAAMALARIISSPTFLMMISKLGAAGGVSVFFGSIAIVLGLCIVNPVACIAVCGAGAGLITLGIVIGLRNSLSPEPEIYNGPQGAQAVDHLSQTPSASKYTSEPSPKPPYQPPYNPALFQAAYYEPPSKPTDQPEPSAPPLGKAA